MRASVSRGCAAAHHTIEGRDGEKMLRQGFYGKFSLVRGKYLDLVLGDPVPHHCWQMDGPGLLAENAL